MYVCERLAIIHNSVHDASPNHYRRSSSCSQNCLQAPIKVNSTKCYGAAMRTAAAPPFMMSNSSSHHKQKVMPTRRSRTKCTLFLIHRYATCKNLNRAVDIFNNARKAYAFHRKCQYSTTMSKMISVLRQGCSQRVCLQTHKNLGFKEKQLYKEKGLP